MTIKKTLAGIALATGAMIAPMAKATPKPTEAHTTSSTQSATQTGKNTMPQWIPTTADGKFDEAKAEDQFKLIWNKNGHDIQQYADNVKAGVPEEIAFTKFAHKLVAGDEKKETEILSLYDTVKKAREKREGQMTNTWPETYANAVMLGSLLSLMAIYKIKDKIQDPNEFAIKSLLLFAGIQAITIGGKAVRVNFLDDTSPNLQQTFVNVQKAMYDSYRASEKLQYTVTDLNTSRQMIQMAKQAKSASK